LSNCGTPGVGEHKTDLDSIKLHIENWKNIGKVPFTRHIEGNQDT
jgi:hypothetical protein